MSKIKERYNKWLFVKYGKTGVPGILRRDALYSPSLFYGYVYDSLSDKVKKEVADLIATSERQIKKEVYGVESFPVPEPEKVDSEAVSGNS